LVANVLCHLDIEMSRFRRMREKTKKERNGKKEKQKM